jgi:hypothetical protein
MRSVDVGSAMLRAGGGLQKGVAALETVLAAPLVLLLGMAAVQWGLVFHGHQAISHAAQQGGRSGSVNHASPDSIERGLAHGLAPWLYGSSGPEDHQQNLLEARRELRRGIVAGWAIWRQLSPTTQSFFDWGVSASDARGDPLPGVKEIPNDNLNLGGGQLRPVSGVIRYRGSEPIGTASGQTLSDANLLKIEFIYGVPLTVPVIGRFAAWVMRGVNGCGVSSQQQPRLGLFTRRDVIELPTADPGLAAGSRAWTCPFYEATDLSGRARPRWPVKVAATVRMQSPARPGGAEQAGSANGTEREALGKGEVDSADQFAPIPARQQNPSGADPTQDGSFDRAPGFLKLGANRLTEPPAACVGL